MIKIETWMFFIPTFIAFAAIVWVCYLFYRNIIVPEQQEKQYWQNKRKYSATIKPTSK